MVKLLLAKGANRDAKYQDGTTPLALATKNNHDEIVVLLTSSSEYVFHFTLDSSLSAMSHNTNGHFYLGLTSYQLATCQL